jgi:hypothetical protein
VWTHSGFFSRRLRYLIGAPSSLAFAVLSVSLIILKMLFYYLYLLLFATTAFTLNFDYESIQLTEAETTGYPAIRFGGPDNPAPTEDCKVIPGDEDWPSDAEWTRFNETLGGALLKPVPLATPCYAGPLYNATQCAQLKATWSFIGMQ